MDTKFGCQPPMSTNGVEVSVEESNSDVDDSLADSNISELHKKTPYLNFFPMSCYQNVQFKQTKGDHVQAQIVSNNSVSADKVVKEEVINTSSPQPINSLPIADQSSSDANATGSIASPTDVTSNTSSVISTTASLLSNVSIPSNETAMSKTSFAVVEILPTTTIISSQVAPSMTNTNACQSAVTTSTSLSSDHTDGPASTSDDPDDLNSKVNSAVIEVGDINPVYQSWQTLKKKTDSKVESKPVPIVAANKEVPDSEVPKATSAYDLMEPILKPSTYNSSVFLSAHSSVVDNQISEEAQPSAPLPMLYENVVPIGNGKFTVTPPSSCDSKENLDFPLESSPTEQQTSLNRSNSTGSLLPHSTVQHHATFHSPANSRKDVLKYSQSLTATPQVVTHEPSDEFSKSLCSERDNSNSKIHIRGSTAISRGSVKKKISLFENSTLPAGSKSLAEMGILEDQDSDNGFIV